MLPSILRQARSFRTSVQLLLLVSPPLLSALPPSFDQFPASEIFRGMPAPPVLVSAFARSFATRIREAAAKGPNFAGKFTIANWGCGTACLQIAVIDEASGLVYAGPFRYLDSDGNFTYPDGSNWAAGNLEPASYRLNSRLLVVRGCPDSSQYQGCAILYYEWQGTRFRLITKSPGKLNRPK
jgi:hypothetical protein